MSKIRSFFRLVRWTNLLMIALMMCLTYYCLLMPLSVSDVMGVMPAPPAFGLLLISIVFIAGGGYVINDLYDTNIDAINKPDRLLVTTIFSEKETKIFYFVLTFIGLLAALFSSVMIAKTKFVTLFALLVLLACVLYSYSSTYKKKLLIGNVIVSLSVAFVMFLPWLFEMIYLSSNVLILSAVKTLMLYILRFVLIYTAFAFVTTMIREIIKDAEDCSGDAVTHCRTIPIVYGIEKTKTILYLLIASLLLLLFAYEYIILRLELYMASAIIMLVALLSIFLIVKIYKAKEKKDFYIASNISKLMMLIGLLSILFLI